jgi:hypothetical protein
MGNKMAGDSNSRDLVAKTGVTSQYAKDLLEKHKAKMEAHEAAIGSGSGRIIFGIDATSSRSETWAEAQKLQTDMFMGVQDIGSKLEVMLGYYRGKEAVFSEWHGAAAEVAAIMSVVKCVMGYTQIEKIFRRTLIENEKKKVNALIFVGDTSEENATTLKNLASDLGKKDIRLFMFGEGEAAMTLFRPMTEAANGECAPFDPKSPGILRDYLKAAAVYATGNLKALPGMEPKMETPEGRKLLTRVLMLPPPKPSSGVD